MPPTTDDLRSLLDQRTRTEPGGPSSDLTATARLAGVRARVRHTRARRAALTAAAAVVVLAGSVSVLTPSTPDGSTPARPTSPATSSALRLAPTLPEKDAQGRPRAHIATVGTNGPRAVTFTVIPRRAGLSFKSECIGSVDVERLVYVNGRLSHRGDCVLPGPQSDREDEEWEAWDVAVGRPLTVEIVLDVVRSRTDPTRSLEDVPPATFLEALYGDVEVVSSEPLVTASPQPIPSSDLPILLRGVLTQDRRRIDVTTTRDFNAYTFVVSCAGATSGLRLELSLGNLGGANAGCGPDRAQRFSSNTSAVIPRGTRVTVMLVGRNVGRRPVDGPLDPVAFAFELQRGTER
jgi:hypothetical protein